MLLFMATRICRWDSGCEDGEGILGQPNIEVLQKRQASRSLREGAHRGEHTKPLASTTEDRVSLQPRTKGGSLSHLLLIANSLHSDYNPDMRNPGRVTSPAVLFRSSDWGSSSPQGRWSIKPPVRLLLWLRGLLQVCPSPKRVCFLGRSCPLQ